MIAILIAVALASLSPSAAIYAVANPCPPTVSIDPNTIPHWGRLNPPYNDPRDTILPLFPSDPNRWTLRAGWTYRRAPAKACDDSGQPITITAALHCLCPRPRR